MKVLIDRSEVDRRIGEMAREIATDYAGAAPLLIGILNGAAQFMMALLVSAPTLVGSNCIEEAWTDSAGPKICSGYPVSPGWVRLRLPARCSGASAPCWPGRRLHRPS